MKEPWNVEELPHSEAEFERLLQQAGARAAIPAEDLEEVRGAVEQEWRTMVEHERQRDRWSRSRVAALAATIGLVIAAGWWWSSRSVVSPVLSVATVELLTGEVRSKGGIDENGLRVGASLASGVELETLASGERPARLALRLESGHSVRLDGGTRIILLTGGRLELARGTIYVDSGEVAQSRGSLEVVTGAGTVRDIGTQFEVHLGDNTDRALRVRVREGEIALTRGDQSFSAGAGEEIGLDSGGHLSRGNVPLAGPIWAWVQATAPGLDIEGITLAAYLRWVARETGWRVEFASDALSKASAGVILHGTLGQVTPAESVDLVLPGSGVGYRVGDGVLVITEA